MNPPTLCLTTPLIKDATCLQELQNCRHAFWAYSAEMMCSYNILEASLSSVPMKSEQETLLSIKWFLLFLVTWIWTFMWTTPLTPSNNKGGKIDLNFNKGHKRTHFELNIEHILLYIQNKHKETSFTNLIPSNN